MWDGLAAHEGCFASIYRALKIATERQHNDDPTRGSMQGNSLPLIVHIATAVEDATGRSVSPLMLQFVSVWLNTTESVQEPLPSLMSLSGFSPLRRRPKHH